MEQNISLKEYKNLVKPKYSKYGNKKVRFNDILFDSQREFKRYKELLLLLKGNLISALEIHPRFILQESVKLKNGTTQRPIAYEADFKYKDNKTGNTVIEDTKGKLTDVYKLKKKMFNKVYPELEITEV